MSDYRFSHSHARIAGFNLILILFLICFAFFTGCCGAEKVPVTISVSTIPEVPVKNQDFHIIGNLSSESGEKLGDRRLILLKSVRDPDNPGSFSYLATVETGKSGNFDFFRPAEADPEYLRVSFAGDDRFAPALSQVLSINGGGINRTHVQQAQTGSITVTTSPAGAEVYVDSVYRGTTPAMVTGLTEGSHALEIAKAGYRNETMESYVLPSRSSSFSVTLNQGQNIVPYAGGLSSEISISRNESAPKAGYAMGTGGISSTVYVSADNETDPYGKYEITRTEADNPVTGEHDYLVIIKDKATN
jgi:hypothetical protein